MKHITSWLACTLLAGCATDASMLSIPEAERYLCENNIAFTVRFASDSAAVNSNRGYEVLYRNARGLNPSSPSQMLYGNRRMRAEFGLGKSGNEAILSYLLQPLVVRCVRD
jgi:hypothetical protein